MLILVDEWWEHHCVEPNPVKVKDVREIVVLREQILRDGIVRAEYGTKARSDKRAGFIKDNLQKRALGHG